MREFPPEGRYLVGVSGGRDSVVLLHCLIASGYRKLIICHLDHGLRGRSSRADASFVARLAKRLALPFELGTADVRSLATAQKLSIETAARAARYNFFAGIARRRRCRTIFLGHHADDLIETFLINLFRGASPTGLTALREVSHQSIGRTQLTVLRPLLSVWRQEIDVYMGREHLRFREDPTNRDPGPLRNRLRHRVIPYLERTLGRRIRETIWRTARVLAEEDAVLENLLLEDFASVAQLPVGEVRELPIALQRRTIVRWLRARDVPNVGYDLVEQVRRLFDKVDAPAKINLPHGRHARRRAKMVFIESDPFEPESFGSRRKAARQGEAGLSTP